MAGAKCVDFGGKVAKILPRILREVTSRQASIFLQGDISFPHIVILEFLKETGSGKMSDLAKILHLTTSAVTAIVDKMVDLNLVKRERSSKDRRVVRISLLKKGEEITRRVGEERKSVANDIFSVLTEQEKCEYLRLLTKVSDSLKG